MGRKSTSIYLTVRVEVGYPETMGKEEAVETVFENIDYDFKLPDGYGITVDHTEICEATDGHKLLY